MNSYTLVCVTQEGIVTSLSLDDLWLYSGLWLALSILYKHRH